MANILLTNFCNARCPFCFASSYMKSDGVSPNQMSLKNLALILDSLKENNPNNVIRLLGGEPSLHGKLDEVIGLIRNKGFKKVIFYSNGMISPINIEVLKKNKDIVSFVWNIVPPAIYSLKTDSYIENTVKALSDEKSVFGINIYKPNYNSDFLFRILNKNKQISNIRLGITHPIGDDKFSEHQKYILVKDYPTIGSLIHKIIMKVSKTLPQINQINLDCGYAPCMFSKKQKLDIKKTKILIHVSRCNPFTDIDTNLETRPCFTTAVSGDYQKLTFNFGVTKSDIFMTNQWILSNKYLPLPDNKCSLCQFRKNCFLGCHGERILVANKYIKKYSKKLSNNNVDLIKKIGIHIEIIKLLIGKRTYSEAKSKILELERIIANKNLKNYLFQLKILKKEINDVEKPTSLNYFEKILTNDKKTYFEIHKMNKDFIKHRSDLSLNKYAKKIMILVNEKANDQYDAWKKTEIKHFIDSLSGIETLIDDPFVLIALLSSIKKIYGEKGENILYPDLLKKQNSYFYAE